MTTLASFREATGLVRPWSAHRCRPVEIVWGLWTAHVQDVDTRRKLLAAAPPVTVVVNAGADECPSVDYGDGIRVVTIDGLLCDPELLSQVDEMEEGPQKAAARAALPHFSPGQCAGNARKDFERVNRLIDDVLGAGGDCLIHGHSSLSRNVVFILAYLMKSRGCSAVEAVRLMRQKWDATWPNDTFVRQLIEYEAEMVASPA
jgi:dual specificity MAP kinase phosphatase